VASVEFGVSWCAGIRKRRVPLNWGHVAEMTLDVRSLDCGDRDV